MPAQPLASARTHRARPPAFPPAALLTQGGPLPKWRPIPLTGYPGGAFVRLSALPVLPGHEALR
jgi:hypothetical protein